jgi:hypothetical protein
MRAHCASNSATALQFDGPGVAPVSITTQTALELAVADITPIIFTCGIQSINTTADNLHGVITMAVTTAHPAGEYKPQVILTPG